MKNRQEDFVSALVCLSSRVEICNREFEVRSRCHGYDIYTARSEGIMRDLGLLNLRVDQEEYNRSLLCLL